MNHQLAKIEALRGQIEVIKLSIEIGQHYPQLKSTGIEDAIIDISEKFLEVIKC